jgi:mRNA interferase MazF
MRRPIARGDIIWANLSAAGGAPLRKKRPCLVVQNDVGNRFAPHTIVAAIRHDPGKALPVQVFVPKGSAGLQKTCVVDCGHIATLEEVQLGERLGRLPADLMRLVDEALRVSLGLP